MDATRNLIDYAMDDNGVEFRNELYASIHDRVTAAIEAKKQEIAGSLIRKEEKEEGMGHEKAEKKMMKSLDKNSDGKHTMADHKKEEVEYVDEAEEKDDDEEKKEEKPKSTKGPSALGTHFGRKSSSGGKTTETKTGRTHTSGDRY
jgi:hypothetical protein